MLLSVSAAERMLSSRRMLLLNHARTLLQRGKALNCLDEVVIVLHACEVLAQEVPCN